MAYTTRLTRFILSAMLLAATALATQPAAAQEDEQPKQEEATPQHEGTLAQTTLEDLGYPGSMLTPESNRVEYWRELPGDWEMVKGSYVEVVYGYGASDKPQGGVAFIELNGERVGKIQLEPLGQTLGRVRVDLPPVKPTPAGLHLAIRYDPRGGDEQCNQPDERGIFIDDRTTIAVTYEHREVTSELATFPYPFAYPRATRSIPITFALPSKPTPAELEAATITAAAIGRRAGSSRLGVRGVALELLDEEYMASAPNLIIIAERSRLDAPSAPSAIQQAVKRVKQTRAPGALALRPLPEVKTRGMLVVTGAPEEGLRWAAQALFSGKSLRGEVQQIARAPKLDEVDIWEDMEATFEELSLGDILFEGRGELERRYYLMRPRGWQLDSNSELVIDLSTSPSVAVGSMLEVKVNDQKLGIRPLVPGERQTFSFSLPDSDKMNRTKEGAPNSWLVLELEVVHKTLEEKEDCDRDLSNTWTTLLSTSRFILKPAEDELPDLSLLPYPLSTRDDQDKTLLITRTDTPSLIASALVLAAEAGRTGPLRPPSMTIRASSEDSTAEAEHHHLVFLGVDRAHELLSRLERDPQTPDFTRPKVPDKSLNGSAVGQLLEFTSPWSPAHVVLVAQVDPGHEVALTDALSGQLPSGDRVVFDDSSKTARAKPTSEAMQDSFGQLGLLYKQLSDWLRSHEFTTLELILLATNVITLMAWRSKPDEHKRGDHPSLHEDPYR